MSIEDWSPKRIKLPLLGLLLLSPPEIGVGARRATAAAAEIDDPIVPPRAWPDVIRSPFPEYF